MQLDKEAVFTDEELFAIESSMHILLEKNKRELSFKEVLRAVRMNKPGNLKDLSDTLDKFDRAVKFGLDEKIEFREELRKTQREEMARAYEECVQVVARDTYERKKSVSKIFLAILTKLALYRNCMIQ